MILVGVLQEQGYVAAETADATCGAAVGGAARGALLGVAIGAAERGDEIWVITGVEEGRAWSLVISDQGYMTLSVTGDGVTWSVFGHALLEDG